MEKLDKIIPISFPEAAKPHPAFEVHRILDHGFLRLIDCMPSPTDPYSVTMDAALVQAARVSYGQGTKTVSEDKGLIDNLIRHRHTSPIEMGEVKIHARMPIFVARQWIRHRTASVNEYSARYSVIPEIYYVPEPDRCQGQSQSNKQGSFGIIDDPEKARNIITSICENSYDNYEELINQGLSRELSRSVQTVGFYTEWYWKIDLHNLFGFCRLRSDSHAQYEIQAYSFVLEKIIAQLAPFAYGSWVNHIRDAISISADEKRIFADAFKRSGITEETLDISGFSKKRQEEFKNKYKNIMGSTFI